MSRYRSAPATFYAVYSWSDSRMDAMVAVAAAIDADPYDLDLRLALAGLLLEAGYPAHSDAQVALVHALAPKAKIAIKVRPGDALR